MFPKFALLQPFLLETGASIDAVPVSSGFDAVPIPFDRNCFVPPRVLWNFLRHFKPVFFSQFLIHALHHVQLFLLLFKFLLLPLVRFLRHGVAVSHFVHFLRVPRRVYFRTSERRLARFPQLLRFFIFNLLLLQTSPPNRFLSFLLRLLSAFGSLFDFFLR